MLIRETWPSVSVAEAFQVVSGVGVSETAPFGEELVSGASKERSCSCGNSLSAMLASSEAEGVLDCIQGIVEVGRLCGGCMQKG